MTAATGLTLVTVVLCTATFALGRAGRVDDDAARGVVDGLLRNVYHAFDFREEERIYDTLAASVSGDPWIAVLCM